jgi:hypothetical protein
MARAGVAWQIHGECQDRLILMEESAALACHRGTRQWHAERSAGPRAGVVEKFSNGTGFRDGKIHAIAT